jgi:hypothetical protein
VLSQTRLQNAVLGRQVLILQQEFLVDQSDNIGQKPRACGCVRPVGAEFIKSPGQSAPATTRGRASAGNTTQSLSATHIRQNLAG